ncbi:tRNA synthetases class I (M)-domain-containing protein [Xylariaceae sp. FL0594]|nr:tRNA synthetases class I (M)-domain-containing protein [Xylariaceae sp. FL0594]
MELFVSVASRRLSGLRSIPIRGNGWIWRSPRACQIPCWRFNSSTTSTDTLHQGVADADHDPSLSPPNERKDEKAFYVTTPIFYVNASPHVGHLYSMLIADVLKRWEVLKGRAAYMSTGTDEHGMKIQRAAQLQDLQPKVLCDANAETFRLLAQKANVSNDRFIRTTDPEHRDAVEYFWARLRESGYIYESKHQGWYCVSDETFYPENMLEKRVSPETGKTYVACVETGNAVEWIEEKNYHFRLTAFRDRLLEFYREKPGWVVPDSRFAEVVDWVQHNLEDLSVSRPSSRLQWGIPVPDDPSQTIYVWLDALVNYLTTAGYPLWQPGSGTAGTWPADVHIVGKDIIRFHCVYWPAFLMALNLPLPKRVLSHGHWLMGDRKMSKSLGNVVNPFFALDRWGVDVMRYYLLYGGQIRGNSNYDNADIVSKYKKGLQGGLGNLVNRVTRPTTWSVRKAVENMTTKKRTRSSSIPPESQELAKTFEQSLATITDTVDGHMKALYPNRALREIMELVFKTNKFFTAMEPWNSAKAGDAASTHLGIFYTAEALRIVGILLQPFMPDKAADLLDRLGVANERRTMERARPFADDAYGASFVDLGVGPRNALFPPLAVED